MKRLLVSVVLSLWITFLGSISYGIGDYHYPIETWLIAFSLPLWSLVAIGFWYDVGRLLLGTLIDNPKSKVPVWIRSLSFVGWMSVAFTYIVWVHISLQIIPMLLVIPFLAIPFYNLLLQDWSSPELITKSQLAALIVWAAACYMTYWILTFGWIILHVTLMDVTTDGFIFYIQ